MSSAPPYTLILSCPGLHHASVRGATMPTVSHRDEGWDVLSVTPAPPAPDKGAPGPATSASTASSLPPTCPPVTSPRHPPPNYGHWSGVCVCACSVTSNSAAPRTVASCTPLSTGFPRQAYWNELPFPPPGDRPDPGIEALYLLHWQADSLPLCHLGRPPEWGEVIKSDHSAHLTLTLPSGWTLSNIP